LDIDDPLTDLTSDQETAIIALIDEMPQWNRPTHRIRDLPGGRRIKVSVSDGQSVLITQGGGPFRVDGPNGILARGQRHLILKVLEPARKALSQLYSDPVPEVYRRLLYLRWKPPEEFCVSPEGTDEVRRNVRDAVRSLVAPSFARFAIAIAHPGENPDQTPRVEWD
jgi:hypothetical protein